MRGSHQIGIRPMELEDKLRAIDEWQLRGHRSDAFGICTVEGDGMLWGHDWEFDRFSDCLGRTCRRCGAFCYDYKARSLTG